MRRPVIWLTAALATIVMTLVVFFPAAWLAPMIEGQTAGRLSLGDAQGSLWRGSAFIGVAASARDPVTPLLPGRFSWQLSPLLLLGRVDLQLENSATLLQPVTIMGSWRQWQVGSGEMQLPAERLAGLGAPLNTIAPTGQMRLSWGPQQLERRDNRIAVQGSMTLDMQEISSKLSSVKPLGSYQLLLAWRGQEAEVTLKTVKGPLLLNGSGMLQNGRLQFHGKAEAAADAADAGRALENLLNLLGQRRREGDKNVIALEFK